MSTYALTIGNGTKVSPSMPASQRVKIHVDLAKLCVAASIAVATGFAANDILQLFTVPAGYKAVCDGVHVLTAEGATLTGDIGDGADVDGFVDGVDLNATGYTAAVFAGILGGTGAAGDAVTLTGYTGGKIYSAADTIDLKILNSGANAAIFDVYFTLFELN